MPDTVVTMAKAMHFIVVFATHVVVNFTYLILGLFKTLSAFLEAKTNYEWNANTSAERTSISTVVCWLPDESKPQTNSLTLCTYKLHIWVRVSRCSFRSISNYSAHGLSCFQPFSMSFLFRRARSFFPFCFDHRDICILFDVFASFAIVGLIALYVVTAFCHY